MMISSVSGCEPNSRIRVSFVSVKAQLFDITTDVLVYVGIALKIVRPVSLLPGDIVEIEIDTPPGYLGHQFYEYTLNDEQNSFAVVNRNDYRPTVKPNDAPRKWFNYFPKEIRTSFYEASGVTLSRPLGAGRNFVNIDVTHVVLDHIKERINFFSPRRELVTSVNLPSGPVEYKKSTYVDSNGNNRVEVFVICNDKKLYRVRFDNQYSESSEFFPTVNFIRSLELIWYEADLPTGESYIDNRRNSLRSKVNPPMTALEVFGNTIWVGGYDTVYVLNKNFQTLKTIRIGVETIVSIACLSENTAYAITRAGKIYQVLASGVYNMFYDAARPLGVPATVTLPNQDPFILVPDPNHQRLLKIVGAIAPVLADSWPTPDHAPAYARVFDGELIVTSHDNNQVLRYTDKNTRYIYEFSEKVTIASWVKDKTDHTMLAVHYLKDYVTLDLTGIEKIIPIKVNDLKGPLSQIGSKPVRLTMLGQENIRIYPGPGMTVWINGIKDEPAVTGDNFGISYKAAGSGFVKSSFVAGDRAYDINIEVIGDDSYTQSFKPGVASVNKISTLSNVAIIPIPTVGNIQTGTTRLNLGLTLNFFGNLYTQINVSTNGYISFGSNVSTGVVTTVGGLDTDALYVEPRDLYQGLALDNSDPGNITFRSISSGQTPAVYYESGDSSSGYNYARIRWVGIDGIPDPSGNIINLVTSITGSLDIPVLSADINKAKRFDFVSGNGIIQTTQVTGTYVVPPYDFEIYKIKPGNQILVTSYTSIVTKVARYSRINDLPVYVTAKSYLLKSNTKFRSNYLIDIYENIAEIDGTIDSAVDQDWAIRIPRFGGSPNYIYQTGITSIVEKTDTITCFGVYSDYDDDGLLIARYTATIIVSQSDFALIKINQTMTRVQSGWVDMHVVNKQIIDNSYVLTASAAHGLNPGDTFTITKTIITTDTNMPTLAEGVSLNLTVGFEYSTLTLSSLFGIQLEPIIVRGFFITVDKPITADIDIALTFKSGDAAAEYTYEVGFYQNNKHQFIEYFYDNSSHSVLTAIGMATGSRKLGKKLLSNVAPSFSSIVYYSEIGTGIFRALGAGSFDFAPRTGVLAPRFSQGITKSDYDYTVEFYIEQDITTTSNVYLASSYGLLQLNGSEYSVTKPIKKNDLVQLTVPFNRSLRAVAPIVSLGNNQFPVPAIASAALGALAYHRFVTDNLARNILVPVTITIPATDYYYIPDIYRAGGGILDDYRYFLVRAGVTVQLESGGNYDLFVGDQLTIEDILTSIIIHDTRDIVIIGQNNAVIVTVKTAGPALVDTLSFNTVLEPYTNNYYYNFSNISNVYVEEFSGYTTENLRLTSNSNITKANLFIGDVNTKFLINSNIAGSYVTNVRMGSNIAIYREFVDYFQSNVDIYQVEYDTVISSNVYIPIGIWNVENRIIVGGEFVPTTSVNSAIDSLLAPVTMFDSTLKVSPENSRASQVGIGKLMPIFDKNFVFVSGAINAKSSMGYTTYETYRLASKFITSSATHAVKKGSSVFSPASYFKIGKITSQYLGLDSYSYIDSIQSTFISQPSSSLGQIYSSYFQGYNEFYIDSVIPMEELETVFKTYKLSLPTHSTFNFLNSAIDGSNTSLTSYNTGKLPSRLEALITILKAALETELENPAAFELIDSIKIILEKLNPYDLIGKLDSDLPVLLSYLSARINSKDEPLANYITDGIDSEYEQGITEFNSKITELAESNTTYNTNNIDSDTYGLIQEIVSIMEKKKENIYTEFWYKQLSIYEPTVSEFAFEHESTLSSMESEFPLTLGIESNPRYNQFSNVIDFIKLNQNWTDARQFRFHLNKSFLGHATKYKIYLDYFNLMFFGQDNIELLDQPTKFVGAYVIEKLDTSALFSWSNMPEYAAFSEIRLPFDPLRDLPPVYLIPFDPLLYKPPQILLALDAMLDIVPESIIPFGPELFQDIVWKMEDIIPEVGAVGTYVHGWFDQGWFNDKWNLREFNSANYVRAYTPMVEYSKEYVYGPGGFVDDAKAEDQKVKYYNAGILKIPGTDFWNYRIYFKDRHFCVPRKGRIFPATWYIRGG